ncbi:UDP-glucuronic acid decarboxylase family protein [Variovorax sp. GrIS 2.14]|uniref:UDP-glucuronic acid decarboxylase family protein n=1 Tax=Variovorax sp. GrIS 2.14 TaxID=3071709 RepID=UPI0038F6FAD3
MSVPVSSQRILVTGGAGFVGSHLCRRLLDMGHRVLCVDNFSTGARRNVARLLANPRFELHVHDITVPLDAAASLIYNLACPASPKHYQSDPIHTMKTSVLGALNMLELAKRNNARVLQASTSEVYGDPTVHPQHENYWGNVNPVGLRSCYDEGKRCAETLFSDFHRQHDVDVRIARIFNTYGPGMQLDDGRVVCNFVMQALTAAPLTVYGDGLQTRCFCFVDDLVDGLIRLMDSVHCTAKPVNLGNPAEITVRDLAALVIEMTGSPSKIRFEPLPSDDPVRRRPDVDSAEQSLGWKATVGLNEGLRQTIAYVKTVLSESGSEHD